MPVLRQATKEIFAANSRQFGIKTLAAGLLVFGLSIAFILAIFSPEAKLRWLHFGYASTQNAMPEANTDLVAPVTNQPANTTSTIAGPQLKWPGNTSSSESEKFAFNTLFKLYGIDLDSQSKEIPCQQAEAKGMHCYAGHGGLSDLFQLDQPVLLRLLSPDGKEYSATLTALDRQNATLIISGSSQRVSLKVLASSWFGQYVSICNAPPDFNGQMALNDHGPAVNWLRHLMESVDGIRDNGSDAYDSLLEKRIRAFQMTDGIQPDGLVGPLTLIRLNVRTGKGGPRLVNEKKG